MIPVVIVSLSPNGLPIAITCCPTCREEEFTIGMGIRFSGEKSSVICNTAISPEVSFPIIFALYVFPSTNVTSAVLAPLITWVLVIMCPCLSYTKPEPNLVDLLLNGIPFIIICKLGFGVLAEIRTTEFSTFLKIEVRFVDWAVDGKAILLNKAGFVS